jgi:hydrogenase expression/formation protein HypC
MCLAMPARIIGKTGDDGIAEVNGVEVDVSLALLPEARVGDFVVLHVGYALSLIDPGEAQASLDAMARLEMAQ